MTSLTPGAPSSPARPAGAPRRARRPLGAVALVVAGLAAGAGGAWLVAGGDRQAATTVATQVVTAAAAEPSAASLQGQFVAVVGKVGPSVVQIESSGGLGSGVILDTEGHIVTNAHVVGSDTTLTVTLANGRRHEATLVGAFPANDLAVVKIDATGLRPVAFASSSEVRVGDIVLAVGSPLGYRSSVTEGIVSALGRTVTEEGGIAIPDTVQTSAPINPGNSGGALVDLQGRLVGIPTVVASSGYGSQAAGIGFAIPADTVRDVATQLIEHGRVVDTNRAYLGVEIGDTAGGQGVYVGAVVEGAPAASAGIRAGDVIVSVDGEETPTSAELASVLAGLEPGQAVEVGLVRADGTGATVEVTLGELPGS